MDSQKVEMFLASYKKYFPADKLVFIKEKLLALDDERFALVSSVKLKNPTTLFLISFFLGALGIDRFMLGQTGMGILKLLTGGVCGVLAIIDWFTIARKTREYNFNNLMTLI